MAVNFASDYYYYYYYYYYVGVESPLDGPVLHGWIHSKDRKPVKHYPHVKNASEVSLESVSFVGDTTITGGTC